MKKTKEPFIPPERRDTIRHEIISALNDRTLSAKDISSSVRISEKEVYEHLEHIRITIIKKEYHLKVIPAECLRCGFIFKKRERLKKPGRCPVCHNEQIQEPLFSITKKPNQ